MSHRGYTPIAPENSLVSFEEAGKRKVRAIETDVHFTKDKRMVCCHDSSTARTYGEDLIIEESSFNELQKLRIATGNRVECYNDEQLRMPEFGEYLDICEHYGAVPFIETKGDAIIVKGVLDELKKRGIIKNCIISSIEFDHIEETRRLNSDVFIHHIFCPEERVPKIAQMGNCGLSYNYVNLDEVPENLIEGTHKAGVRVCLRAGDDAETVIRMMKMGLDYIPTNTMYKLPDR